MIVTSKNKSKSQLLPNPTKGPSHGQGNHEYKEPNSSQNKQTPLRHKTHTYLGFAFAAIGTGAGPKLRCSLGGKKQIPKIVKFRLRTDCTPQTLKSFTNATNKRKMQKQKSLYSNASTELSSSSPTATVTAREPTTSPLMRQLCRQRRRQENQRRSCTLAP
jgi:hypothetical protein